MILLMVLNRFRVVVDRSELIVSMVQGVAVD